MESSMVFISKFSSELGTEKSANASERATKFPFEVVDSANPPIPFESRISEEINFEPISMMSGFFGNVFRN